MVDIKRKIKVCFLSIILLMSILNPIKVDAGENRVFDDANLFSDDEIMDIDSEANIISDDHNIDIIIVTTDDSQGKTATEYADDYFDDNEFGRGDDQDGILFLIDMDNREACISTSGKGIEYLTDQRIENIIRDVIDSGLGEGDYYNSTQSFLKTTNEYLEMGIPGQSVQEENTLTLIEGIISLISGALLSLAFFFGIKSKYKMKNPEKVMDFRKNSLVNISAVEDRYIDKVVTHRKIPKAEDSGKSTTHKSSSGKKHGGGSAKF